MVVSMKHVVLTLSIIVTLFGCGGKSNVLDSGEVTELKYDDPDEWTTINCASYNSNGTCSLWLPQNHYDDAHYELKIAGAHENEIKEEWHSVDEQEYHSCERGDHYTQGKGCTTG